ncbi:NAD(P)-dependent dehydrogenase, short-chain alcohol dehydrogenase family [Thermomonospora echinospora]|uniref:NAD(P)-dependent dehydrogenase, short-chain alcohol dehydrogenase family n=1 Tax=Thermomonospora echinospora TaxID=1992 RepID=A0A1H6BNR8_9ACTN|nr:SDR family oxidoreductase [Thermomonospora echinospora]SEG62359.1 NAD(P)-dependent dehydrogenase, short-chain alcohol dehydrogenase family [Thermomonospora echinospora]
MAVALITGAADELGLAVARRLASEGHLVALSDLPRRERLETLHKLAAKLGGPGAALVVPADVADPEDVARMVAEVEERAGEPIGILVTVAGYLATAPFLRHDPDDWWRVVDTNLGGVFACAQAVLPGMAERGGGRMIFIASEWGVTGRAGATACSAAEAGIIAMAKSLGRELGQLGIAVNAIAPGVVDTSRLEADAREAGVTREVIRTRHAARVPLGRIAAPEEIAAAVAFLADPRMISMVGQVLHINGGTTRARG